MRLTVDLESDMARQMVDVIRQADAHAAAGRMLLAAETLRVVADAAAAEAAKMRALGLRQRRADLEARQAHLFGRAAAPSPSDDGH